MPAVIPHGKIVTPAIAKARLTEISGEDGWDVLSAPSVVTLEGHDATVEIGKELIFAAGDEPKFVGLKVLLHLESAGGGAILTKVHAVLTAASGEKGDSAPVLTFEQKFRIPGRPRPHPIPRGSHQRTRPAHHLPRHPYLDYPGREAQVVTELSKDLRPIRLSKLCHITISNYPHP